MKNAPIVVNPRSSFNTPPKKEQFVAGYSIHQAMDGSFIVYAHDASGNKARIGKPTEFYANAVCALIQRLVSK